jgi:plastocyanin
VGFSQPWKKKELIMFGTEGTSVVTRGFVLLSRTLLYYSLLGVAVALMFTMSGRAMATASLATVTIKMLDMPPAFSPASVTIKAGDTVEWQNVGNEVHHATNDPSMAINSGDVSNPATAEPFDSGFMRPGESFTHIFTKAGVYKYACAVHETKGMIGQIIVK